MNTIDTIKVLQKEKELLTDAEQEYKSALNIAIFTLKERNLAIVNFSDTENIEKEIKKAQRFKTTCRVFISIFSCIIGLVLGIALSYAAL